MKLKYYLNEETNKEKAGSIVYYNDKGKLFFMFMIPSDPLYGGSEPQIAKGHIDGNENPKVAAIREASEELGLKKSNIKNVIFLKKHKIIGMTRSYGMNIFGIEVYDKKDFNKPHYETGKVVWLTENKLNKIRKSQRQMVIDSVNIIKNNIK